MYRSYRELTWIFRLKDTETDSDNTSLAVHIDDDVVGQDNTAIESEITIDNEEVAALSNDEAALSMDSNETDSGNDENPVPANFGSLSEGLILQLVGEVIWMLLTFIYGMWLKSEHFVMKADSLS